MNKFILREKYLKSLPKKRVSAGVLLFNKRGEILLVKPRYKDHWSIPGGVCDENETPTKACIRETEEEIGLKLKSIKIVALTYLKRKTEIYDGLHFYFYGGVLPQAQMDKIKIEFNEISKYKFVMLKDLGKYNRSLSKKIIKIFTRGSSKPKFIYTEEIE